ncbi:hypothetical protein H2248_000888 [Termitomyces sp. 'cryptogamus']|nr:hypothetical protein H2248_000888 [Termitomyces sp. 'cryptogamus']
MSVPLLRKQPGYSLSGTNHHSRDLSRCAHCELKNGSLPFTLLLSNAMASGLVIIFLLSFDAPSYDAISGLHASSVLLSNGSSAFSPPLNCPYLLHRFAHHHLTQYPIMLCV